MKNIMEKQALKPLEDNKTFAIGELVLLKNDWDHFGIGIVKKVLTLDEIMDIYNENVMNLALYTRDRVYAVYFINGTEMRAFGRELKNAE